MVNLGIRNKLLFAFLAAAIIPIILVFLLNLFSTQLQARSIFDLYLKQSRVVTDSTAEKLDYVIQNLLRKVKLLQSDKDFNNFAQKIENSANNKPSKEYQAAKEYLNKVLQPLQRLEELNDFFVINQKGSILYASNNSHYWKYLDKNFEDIFKIPLENIKDAVLSDIITDPEKGNSYNILVMAPLEGQDVFQGYIVAEVPMDLIYRTLNITQGPGKTTQLFLGKLSGDSLLVASPIEQNYKAINKVDVIKNLPRATLDELQKNNNGYGIASDYDNRNVLFLWKKIPLLNLLILKTDIAEIYSNIEKSQNFTFLSSLLITGLFTLLAIYLANRITSPIVKLSQNIQSLDLQGSLVPTIEPEIMSSNDEIGALARVFKQRSTLLQKAFSDLKQAQHQLILSEKMAALGNLVAGVAHEVNTPLGAINASISNIESSLDSVLNQFPQLKDFIDAQPEHIQGLQNIRIAKRNLIERLKKEGIDDSEKIGDYLMDMGMTSNIEKIVEILHQPNGNQLIELAFYFSSLKKNAWTINESLKRISRIVFALRNYAHFEDERAPKIKENIIPSIENSLTLYQNKLKAGIEVVRNYADIPNISCHIDQLNQVWVNIIQNALDAMNNNGTLTIDVYPKESFVCVRFTDTGTGIENKNMNRIWEPFFSTKDRGEGSGIGLTVVKRVVERHGGNIEIQSEPGKTVFTISLPIDGVSDNLKEEKNSIF